MSKENENKPYVENYPPLHNWLLKHGGRCMFQLAYGPKNAATLFVEQWMFPGGRVALVVVVHANKHGWEIYTAADTIAIDATLLDAEERLGLKS